MERKKITATVSMFKEATSFNGNLTLWNAGAVADMSSMFYSGTSFNGDLSLWNVCAVTSMNGMFRGASSFNGNLSLWNVGAVKTCSQCLMQLYYLMKICLLGT